MVRTIQEPARDQLSPPNEASPAVSAVETLSQRIHRVPLTSACNGGFPAEAAAPLETTTIRIQECDLLSRLVWDPGVFVSRLKVSAAATPTTHWQYAP